MTTPSRPSPGLILPPSIPDSEVREVLGIVRAFTRDLDELAEDGRIIDAKLDAIEARLHALAARRGVQLHPRDELEYSLSSLLPPASAGDGKDK